MVYYILIFFVFALWVNKESRGANISSTENVSCYWICAFLIFIAAFRGVTVGADDISFIADYSSMNAYTFPQLYEYKSEYIGYYALSKCFSLLGAPVQIWFAFLEAFYLFALFSLVNKFSKDKILSLLIFICIGLMGSSFTHLKQILSASFAMLSFLSFVDKKYIRTILLYVLAFISHSSALVIIIAYIFYYFRGKNHFYILLGSVVVFLYLQQQVLLTSSVEFLGNDHFETYLNADNTYSYATFIYYLVLLIICLLSIKKYSLDEKGVSRLFYASCTIACCLQLYAAFSPSLFRLANFYTPFFMVLIPNSLHTYSRYNRRVLSLITMSILAFFLLYTTREKPYLFIWDY